MGGDGGERHGAESGAREGCRSGHLAWQNHVFVRCDVAQKSGGNRGLLPAELHRSEGLTQKLERKCATQRCVASVATFSSNPFTKCVLAKATMAAIGR